VQRNSCRSILSSAMTNSEDPVGDVGERGRTNCCSCATASCCSHGRHPSPLIQEPYWVRVPHSRASQDVRPGHLHHKEWVRLQVSEEPGDQSANAVSHAKNRRGSCRTHGNDLKSNLQKAKRHGSISQAAKHQLSASRTDGRRVATVFQGCAGSSRGHHVLAIFNRAVPTASFLLAKGPMRTRVPLPRPATSRRRIGVCPTFRSAAAKPRIDSGQKSGLH